MCACLCVCVSVCVRVCVCWPLAVTVSGAGMSGRDAPHSSINQTITNLHTRREGLLQNRPSIKDLPIDWFKKQNKLMVCVTQIVYQFYSLLTERMLDVNCPDTTMQENNKKVGKQLEYFLYRKPQYRLLSLSSGINPLFLVSMQFYISQWRWNWILVGQFS